MTSTPSEAGPRMSALALWASIGDGRAAHVRARRTDVGIERAVGARSTCSPNGDAERARDRPSAPSHAAADGDRLARASCETVEERDRVAAASVTCDDVDRERLGSAPWLRACRRAAHRLDQPVPQRAELEEVEQVAHLVGVPAAHLQVVDVDTRAARRARAAWPWRCVRTCSSWAARFSRSFGVSLSRLAKMPSRSP